MGALTRRLEITKKREAKMMTTIAAMMVLWKLNLRQIRYKGRLKLIAIGFNQERVNYWIWKKKRTPNPFNTTTI